MIKSRAYAYSGVCGDRVPLDKARMVIMALIICKECSKQFSDQASKCPHCGKAHTNRAAILGLGLGIMVLIVIIASCFFGGCGL